MNPKVRLSLIVADYIDSIKRIRACPIFNNANIPILLNRLARFDVKRKVKRRGWF
jgi:hypothetical protein